MLALPKEIGAAECYQEDDIMSLQHRATRHVEFGGELRCDHSLFSTLDGALAIFRTRPDCHLLGQD